MSERYELKDGPLSDALFGYGKAVAYGSTEVEGRVQELLAVLYEAADDVYTDGFSGDSGEYSIENRLGIKRI